MRIDFKLCLTLLALLCAAQARRHRGNKRNRSHSSSGSSESAGSPGTTESIRTTERPGCPDPPTTELQTVKVTAPKADLHAICPVGHAAIGCTCSKRGAGCRGGLVFVNPISCIAPDDVATVTCILSDPYLYQIQYSTFKPAPFPLREPRACWVNGSTVVDCNLYIGSKTAVANKDLLVIDQSKETCAVSCCPIEYESCFVTFVCKKPETVLPIT